MREGGSIERLRILAFNDAFWPQVGGVETFLLQLATYLHAQGFEVVVATRTAHEGASPLPFPVHWQPRERQLHALVDWCDLLHLNTMHVGMFLRAVWRRKRIVTTNHDVTMICPKGTKIRPDGPCTNRAGPVVCSRCLHRSGVPQPWRRLVRPPLKGLLSALADANVVTSPWALRRYKLFHKRLIPLGTDLEHFSPGPAPTEQDGADRLPRVIFVGRVEYEKGLAVLVEALRRCRDAGRPFRLLVCGDGGAMADVRALVARHDLTPLVEFRGIVRGAALVAALRSADVAVVPSLWDEAFGLTAIEAMGCGLPVLAADTGGLGSIVAELGPEMVFARGEAGQLAERLQALLADPARRQAMGVAARRVALERYDVERMLRAYRELFAALARRPRGVGGRLAPTRAPDGPWR